jgi:outer membrane biosynthesis protein TonB
VPLVLCVGTVQASVAVPVLEEVPVPVPVPDEVPVPVPEEVPVPVPEEVPVPVPEEVLVPVPEEVPVEEDVVEEDVAAEVEASGPAPTTPQADKQQMVAINAANRVAATLFSMQKTMGVFQYAQGIRANCRQLVTVLPRVERDDVL